MFELSEPAGGFVTLSYEKTKTLIESLLKWDRNEARGNLHEALVQLNSNEPEFYAGIIEHGPALLTTDQWFELLSRLPLRILHAQLDLNKILSEDQRRRLPPVTG